MYRVGDVVFIKNASAQSMQFYKLHSERHSYLICPCKVPKTQSLVIASMLSPTMAMLYYNGDKSKVTIVFTGDLQKAVIIKDD